MPISHYSSGKYGDNNSSSTNNNGSSSSYYSRSRESGTSERGGRGDRAERDKEWSGSSRGREWRRGERDRSRERDRDKDRIARSPSRSSRFASDYNSSNNSRERESRRYAPSAASARSPPPPAEDQGRGRVSRFGSGGRSSGYSGQTASSGGSSSYPTVPTGATTSLIREKDLLQNPGLTNSILHGNQYGSYHFSSHGHFSDFPSYSSLGQRSEKEKDPKDDPLFKAAVDTLIMNMKTKGDYDQVRKECFSDIDTKAAFINLHARIKSTVDKYLGLQVFTKDMDKVKTREGMRKKILDTPYFEKGIESVVSQILTPKINSLIRPKVEEEVFKYLKVDKNGGDESLESRPTNDSSENHTKHESIETREIMPNSPIHKDVNDKPKGLLSKVIGMSEPSEDTHSPSSSSQEPYRIAPPAEHSTETRDSDMSESLSERSLEIDLDARSEMMDESSGTRPDEPGPVTPPEPEPSTHLPDTRVPPPPPPPPPPASTPTSSSVIATNVAHSCPMPNMSIAPPPPYGGPPVAFGGHIAHFGLNVLPPPTHGIMDHSLSLGSMPHAPGMPPPLPPLPPSGSEHPPPPPSPPKPQVPPPPPPPMCDDACSSPPGGSRMLISNDEEEEPLPPGEEPDSYFSQMRLSKVPDKPEMPPPPPPPPEPVEVDLASIKLPGEDSEVEEAEEEEEVEEEDSEEESPMFEKIDEVSPPRVVLDSEEEESPMFEKICEVSPPRPVELLQNCPLVQELRKELLGEEVVDANGNQREEREEATVAADGTTTNLPERRSSNSSSGSCSSNECKYLENIPEIDYKVSFYKRIPDS